MDVMLIFSGILIFFCLVGFLLGLLRGMNKSLLRFGFVLLSAVLAFFLATGIASSIMSTPFADLPASIQDAFASEGASIPLDTPLHKLLITMIAADESVGQLLAATPTLTNFIMAIPQALISVVLFVVLFFLIKLVMMIPGAIVSAIVIRKKKGKRLIGGAVGALQGILCACVILVPVFGMMTTLDAAISSMPEIDPAAAEEGSIAVTLQELNEQYYQPLKNDPGYAVLKTVGLKSLCGSVYYGLSTVKAEDGTKTSVFRDVDETIPAVMQLTKLEQVNFESPTNDDVAALRELCVAIGDSSLVMNTVSEIVSTMAETLLEGDSFMGINAPSEESFGKQGAALMNDTLSTFTDLNGETLKANLPQIVDIYGVMVDHGAMDAFSESDNAIVELLADEAFTGDLLSAMTKSDILSPIAVSAVNNIGIEMIADALGILEDDAAVYESMVNAVAEELAKSAPRDEKIEAVAHVLLHHAKDLSEEQATVAATALVDALADAMPEDVTNALQNGNENALKEDGFKSALKTRKDLGKADIHLFENMTEEERAAEVENLTHILHNASDTMLSLGEGFEDLSSQLDILPSIGGMLNAMEDSALLTGATEGMLQHFLEMDEVKEVVAEKALNTLSDKIAEGKVDYKATFSSISAAYRLAHTLGANKTPDPTPDPDPNPNPNPNPDPNPGEGDVGGETPDKPIEEVSQELVSAVEDLFQSMDQTTADIMKDAVDESFLSNMGIPEKVTESAQVIVSTFFDEIVKTGEEETEVDYEQESKAVETIVDIVVSTGSAETKVEDVINTDTLDAIVSSSTISNTLISISKNEEVEVDLSQHIGEEERAAIDDIITEYQQEGEVDEKTAACLDALRDLLGIDPSQFLPQ